MDFLSTDSQASNAWSLHWRIRRVSWLVRVLVLSRLLFTSLDLIPICKLWVKGYYLCPPFLDSPYSWVFHKAKRQSYHGKRMYDSLMYLWGKLSLGEMSLREGQGGRWESRGQIGPEGQLLLWSSHLKGRHWASLNWFFEGCFQRFHVKAMVSCLPCLETSL